MVLVTEIGDFRRFEHRGELMAHCRAGAERGTQAGARAALEGRGRSGPPGSRLLKRQERRDREFVVQEVVCGVEEADVWTQEAENAPDLAKDGLQDCVRTSPREPRPPLRDLQATRGAEAEVAAHHQPTSPRLNAVA